MLSLIQILGMYFGNNPIAKHNPPCVPLSLPASAAQRVSKGMREALLQSQSKFRMTVGIPGLAKLDLDWIVAGQTSGIGIWSRDRDAGCVSLFLCGLDEARERGEALAVLASRRLPVPSDINAKLDRESRRPLLVNVFYNLAYLTDPVVATLSPMLAYTYFASLGINVEKPE
jgi:hypothetical protein